MKSPLFRQLGIVLPALLLSASALHSAPVISEFLTSNGDILDDIDGDSSDWIEIHNPDPGTYDLSNHALTDDPTEPLKWLFPSGTSIAPGQRLVVFASEKNRTVAGQQLHTNFSLSSSSGYLSLNNAAGTPLSTYAAYPDQRRDVSYGISNTSTVAFLDPPTPGNANGPALSGFVEDTTFSHKRGFYDASFSVTISTLTPGASIRYTTNGTKPTPTSGILYTGPIPISSTTNLRALAYKTGMVPTNVDANTYLFTSDIVTQPNMSTQITNAPAYSAEIQPALKALPVVSLSFSNTDLFGAGGIYTNSDLKGRAHEKEIHFEYFDPNDSLNSTHESAGIRMHGGNSREHPKKAMRLYFRDDYGKKRLNHPLYPESPVDSFKHLLLRGGGHDAWTFQDDWDQATFIRNEFLHRLQLAMGQPSPRGQYVNLFLNGDYWGLYELQELPYAHFNADHLGGEPEDWDVVKHGAEVEGGTITAWNNLISLANAGINSPAEYEAIQEYIDLDNFADALIHRIWSSDEDWLSPFYQNGIDVSTFFSDKNWYVGRQSRNGAGKFHFYSWDAEMSMGIPFANNRTFINDFSQVNNPNSPGIIYYALRSYPEFQIHFADRLQKHMFNGGPLDPVSLLPLWDFYADQVRSPVVAESARWGRAYWGGTRTSAFTRDDEWTPAANWVRSQFLINRTSRVRNHFRDVDLYPTAAAPRLIPFSQTSPTPHSVTMSTTTAGSTIYYTTDGSDPRLPVTTGSTFVLLDESAPTRAVVPDAAMNALIGTTWKHHADPSNINSWLSGTNGVGYEANTGSSTSYAGLIDINLTNMRDVNPSAYIRIKFNIPDQATLDSIGSLDLRMRFDDGFHAYLNNTLVESQNANTFNYNSISTTFHSDTAALNYVSHNISAHISALQVGENVLAIHGQNQSIDSSDFLIQARLEAGTGSANGDVSPTATAYTGAITVASSQVVKARTLAPDGTWSALTEAEYLIGTPADSTNLLVTELHYHPVEPTTPAELAASANADNYEFLELLNTGTTAINLSNCTFDRGLSFTFPLGTSLDVGERAVIVRDAAAFTARYGTSATILGEFANTTNLSNGGENLTLLAANGTTIFNFTYNDKTPWPEEADGDGPSLTLIDPDNTLATELGDASKWKASLLTHGTPGQAETTGGFTYEQWAQQVFGNSNDPHTAATAIAPGETLPNLIRYAQGDDLNNSPLAQAMIADHNGQPYLTLTYQARVPLNDANLVPQISTNLITWENSTVLLSTTPNGDGTETISVRDALPYDPATPRFIRLSSTLTPIR